MSSQPVSASRPSNYLVPLTAAASLVALSAVGYLFYRSRPTTIQSRRPSAANHINSSNSHSASAAASSILYFDGSPLAVPFEFSSLPAAYQKLIKSSNRIEILSDSKQLQKSLNELLNNSSPDSGSGSLMVCGLDCEWHSNSSGSPGKVALLQLSMNGVNLLIQLQRLKEIPIELKQFLSNPAILKCGVAITDDARKLSIDFGLIVKGIVELGEIANSARKSNQQTSSLASLCLEFVGVELPKDRFIVCSNWELFELSSSQLFYAAADSFFGLEIFNSLWNSQNPNYMKSKEKVSESTLIGRWLADVAAEEKIRKVEKSKEKDEKAIEKAKKREIRIKNREEKEKNNESQSSESKVESSESNSSNPTLSVDPLKSPKTPRRRQRKKNPTETNSVATDTESDAAAAAAATSLPSPARLLCRVTQLYDNCKMVSPDGVFMAFINKKKCGWYYSRGLADIVSDQGIVLQFDDLNAFNQHLAAVDGSAVVCKLKFHPAGLGNATLTSQTETTEAGNYYLEHNENRCIRCGLAEQFRKHYIVPAAYRKYFPRAYKSHSSHDILLLCNGCHKEAEAIAVKLMKAIANETKFPMHPNQAWRDKIRAAKEQKTENSTEQIPILENEVKTEFIKRIKQLSAAKPEAAAATAGAESDELKEIYYAAFMISIHGNTLDEIRKAKFQLKLQENFPAPANGKFTESQCDFILQMFEIVKPTKNKSELKDGYQVDPTALTESDYALFSASRVSHFDFVVRELSHLNEIGSPSNSVYTYFDNDTELNNFDSIARFNVRWRKDFMDLMKPEYLNPHWSMYFNKPTKENIRN